ncbi:MAG: hypothetical protein D8H95_33280 [Lachnospiraceae bacterium]|nr:MAG: hypothetical protein D8H95_33280 [Lachnospiraceae bacterium]
MLDLRIMLLVTFLCYMLLYLFCWAVDKDDIESYQKKIKLNKYTNKLFFLWKRSEKIYWIVYIIIITESLIFILLWISYFLKTVFIYKILLNLYIRVYLSAGSILVVKILIKRIKDFISGKSR